MKKQLFGFFVAFAALLSGAGKADAAPDKVTVTAATGGSSISADSTGGSWTTLTGPSAVEANAGNIGTGTIILSAPAGFLFNASASVTVRVNGSTTTPGNNINDTPNNGTISATVAADGSTVTLTISAASSSTANTLTWQNLQIRPTAGTPLASGNITRSGTSTLLSLTLSTGTWGAITEVPGAGVSLAFGQQPVNTAAGVSISPAVTVRVLDQFGNLSASSASVNVAIANNPGGGTLSGTLTTPASSGTATFSNLSIDKAGTGYTLVASSGVLAGDTSSGFNITAGTATKLVFTTSGQSLTAGVASGTITVQIQDANGNAVNQTSSARTINLSSTSGGGVFRNAADTANITTLTIPVGINSTNFLYRDTVAGTPTITAATTSPTSLTSATQGETVGAAAAALVRMETLANGAGVIVPGQSVTSGNSLTVFAITRDAFSNFVANVAADSWSLTGVTGGVVSGDLIPAGDSKSATFTGHLVGSAKVHASSGALTSTDSGTLTVQAGAAAKLGFTTGPQTLIAGVNSSTITVQIQDAGGNAVAAGSARVVNFSTTSAVGLFRNVTDTSTITTLTIAAGSSSTNFLYRDPRAGTPTITASTTSPSTLTSATQIETVNPGSASKLQILLPGETAAPGTGTGKTGTPTAQTASIVIPGNIVVNAVDANWNVVSSATPNVTITSSDTGAVIADDNGGTAGNLSLVSGTGSLSSFTFNSSGSQTCTATDAGGALTANTSAAVAVSTASTTTTVASSQNPSVFGQAVTFTATVSTAAGTPTGTITFKDGAATLGTGTLDGSAQATFLISSLSVSSHSITAVYGGSSTYGGSTSSAVSQVVNKANSSVGLSASTNSSVFGQPVIFTASVSAVAPGVGTPTGTVTFKDGATSLATNTLNAGQANYTNAALSSGAHSITAVYNGDGNFVTNASSVLATTVNKADTTTTVSSSANPSVSGQSVTFTATVSPVAPGAGTRTGTVTFTIDGTPQTPSAVNGSGQATFSLSSLSVDVHTVTAAYNGDANFNVSDSTASPLTQTVNQDNTVTTVGSSANPSVFGQSVTFTATVTASAPGSGTPSGTITFKNGATTLGTRTVNSGQAVFTTSSLGVGANSITGVYNGDDNFISSTSSTLTQTVNQASTTTTVASSANPSVFGQSVTFTATVSPNAPGGGTPTGTVTFKDGATTLGSGTLSSGQATFTPGSLSIGTHSITAVYAGDANFNTNTSSALSQSVTKASSTTVLDSSVNPSVYGQPITFTATVNPVAPSGGTPTGTVTFKDGATSLATNTLSGGQAIYIASTLSVGSRSITAVYNADASFNASTSPTLTQTVNKTDSTTTLASSANPAVFGQSVIITATVAAVSPGGGVATGTVIFKDGATSLATNNLSGGQANYTNASLTIGSHSFTAVYNGDANFITNTSPAMVQVVNPADTTTTVTGSASPSVFGQSVTFTATVSPVAPGAGTRTGTVQFQVDGVAFGGPVTLAGGTATSGAIASLSVGAHSVTAAYSGDSHFNASDNTVSPLTQTVNQANTTTTVASSANPAVFGQSITFTATVAAAAPGAGTPTGTVTFKDAGVTLGTGTLSSGQATFATSSLSGGSHSITAVYEDDSNFNVSTSSTLTQTINKSGSLSTLTSSTNPTVFGQSVTFTATVSAVAPGSGTPTGTVTFKDGATSLATNAMAGGQATLVTTTLSAAAHSITAVYNGDVNFNTSTNSPALTQTVNKATSAVALSSSTNSSLFGQPVIFTAAVSGVAPGGGTPTGTVTFKDGATSLSTNTLVGGQVNYTNAALSVAAHSITAVYNGDGNFLTITSSILAQTVIKADTTTTVTASANPSVFGQSVTFTATVSPVSPGAGTRTGTVQFQVDGAPFGGPVTLSGGSATSSAISSLSVGDHIITAAYTGDGNFNGSDNTASPLTQTVNPANTTSTVGSSANPSVFGQSVTFTATVSAVAPGSGTPTGTVTFKDGAATLGTRTLSSGQATFITSSLSVAAHSITVVYNSDGNFNTSTSSTLTQTVNLASTTTTVASSANPSVSGQSVTFTATVSPTAPGGGTPTGTVTFKDGATTLGTGSLSSGQATFTPSSLSIGAHTITAVYGGDPGFNASTNSPALTQTVNKASSTTLLGSSVNPSVFGQSVTFTATVNAVAPASGTPTGTVTFKDGATSLATNALSGGQATFTTSSLSVAAHSITSVYNADANFNTSTSSALTQTVNKSDTVAGLSSSTNPVVFGQAVVFTAIISASSPGVGTPTGTVTFKDGATSLSTNTLSAGQASCTNAALSVAAHSITAVYNGDGNFNTTTSAVVTETVNLADTTTTVASSANPSVFGQFVTFTATVNAVAPGAGTRTGTVQFFIDGTPSGTPVTLSGGTAATSISSLSVAGHIVTAVYSGDSHFNDSDNLATPLTQTVNPANTTTTVASSANPSVSGQSVTFTATVATVAPGSGTASGTVTFKDGATTLGTGTLSSGQATFTTSALSVAAHSITAVYGTDGNYNTSTSPTLTQTVNKDSSTTTLGSSANPSVAGQSVTFTATVSPVAPGSGTPTGTVTFKDGTTSLITNALSGGQATFTTSTLSVSAHSITAVYNGDASFNTSTNSPALTQTVNKAGTTTAVASSANPSVSGQSVTFTATVTAVAPGTGTPTGTVTFKDGATALVTNALSAGQATFATSTLSVAAHAITAVYNADANFSGSTNSPALTQTVNQADTSVTLSSSTNTSVFGQPVIFTANVSAVAPGGGTPTGTVTFRDGATPLSTNNLSAGQVSYTNAALSVGAHSITATYNGDVNFNTNSSGVVTQTVNQAATTTTLASSANPSVFGQSVTFTATVNAVAPGAGTRTGTVTFKEGATTLGTGTLSSGQATFVTSALSVGAHTITAIYGGDANFTGSDNTGSPLTQTVNPANTTTTLASSANPSVSGQSVTFTATVSAVAPGAGTPTGTVTFKDGAATLGTGSLSSGQATFTTTSLSVASHSITAVYGADVNFNTSTSATLTQTVNKDASAVALASSANPSVFGQSVIFTAIVSAVAPGTGTPTGTVMFKDGATALATNALSAGQATFAISSLAVSAHSITAVYNGDANFSTNTSSALSQTVNKAGTTVGLSSSTNSAVFGQPVIFTAIINPAGPGAGTPTGTVTFKDGATSLSTNTLSGGQVNYTNASLSVAAHSITAIYNGDGNFTTNTSSVLTQTIIKADTTTTVAASANPSVFGQTVTFTATISPVSPGAGTRTGTVTFTVDGTTQTPAAVNGSGQATLGVASLGVGSHTITAAYNGDANFNGSDSTASPLSQTVNQANTTTTVASSANPSVFGQFVTFTATVSPVSPGSGVPSGTIIFTIDGTPQAPITMSGGSAAFGTSSLSTGNHTVTAAYGADANFNSSDNTASPLAQIVNKASTSVAVVSSVNPSVFGQSVSFTATVSAVLPGVGTPTGTVTFKDGATTLGTGTLSSGQAVFSTTSLSVASHPITAVYGGDTSFNTNTSATLTQTVNKSPSAAAISSSPNPSIFGQSVTFTATVSAGGTGAGTPTGTVTFKDGTNTLGAGALSSGLATLTTSVLLAGSHTNVTAAYGGDGNFATSTSSSFTHTVNQAGTTTSLASSANPSVFGQPVIFTATLSAVAPGAGTPTGTVVFKDGATALATNTLSSGQANYTNAGLAVAAHTISAVYNGDANFSTSTSSSLTQVVNQAETTISLASSSNPSVFGQPVTFTATVSALAPGAGTRTGTVQFRADGVPFGSPVTLSGGTAVSGAISSLAVSTHTITAIYSGDGNFNGTDNNNSPLLQTVNQANTTTTLASSANPSIFAQVVTFTATVSATAPGAGTPTGPVVFKDGATALATNTLIGGQATFATAALSVGSHSITAVYDDDNNFNPSTSAALTQTVNKQSTTTALISSLNPSTFGQSVTLTATVSGTNVTPTGTVTFKDGATPLATNALTAGQATLTTASLPSGLRSLTAVYNGDGIYNASTNSPALSQIVNKSDTTATLVSSTNPTIFGQPIVFTAAITAVAPGAGTPTGTVTLKDGTTSVATSALVAGQVNFTNTSLSAGSHTLTALYNGDGNFNTNTSSAVTQMITIASSTTTVSSTVSPSVFGQAVSFVAAVNPVAPSVGTRSGTVQFILDGSNSGSPVTLSNGSATSAPNASLSVGLHTITAVYSGDTNFTGSTSPNFSQTVNKADVTATVTSTLNPGYFDQPIAWNVAVGAVSPGAGTPGGTAQFTIDGTNFDGLITLSGGSATSLNYSNLAVGPHSITAVYSGDGNFSNRTSAIFTQTINASPLTLASGGGNISADAIGGTYTNLTGPIYQEPAVGAIGTGNLVLNAPAGFVFDTGGTAPTVLLNGGSSVSRNINGLNNGATISVTVTPTNLTININASSRGGSGSAPNKLTWQNVRVRPSAGTPLASGRITKSGGAGTASMVGVTDGATSFGQLTEIAGAARRLVIQTQPSATATAGVAFAQQPAIQIQDQFGNARSSANGNVDNSTVVTAARSAGTSALQGVLTATANNGTASFANLSYNTAETITVLFTSGSLTNATSGNIVVSPGAADRLVFTTQPGSTTYGSLLSPQPALKSQDAFGNYSSIGLGASKMVTLTLIGTGPLTGTASLDIGTSAGNGTVTFTDLQVNAAGAGKQLSAAASGLIGLSSSNFTIAQAVVTASITASNKIYDRTTAATIATRSLSGVVGSDDVILTGGTASFGDKTAANGKTVTATGLGLSGGAAANYALASTSASTTANISKAPLGVTGVLANNKVYDRLTTATLSGSASLLGVIGADSVTLGGTPVGNFTDKTVGTGKLVNVSGYTISGADSGNYALAQPTTTASITKAGLTVTGIVAEDKIYDGTTTATLFTGGAHLAGVFSGDIVNLVTVGAIGTFADPNIGVGKLVTVSGLTISGGDAANYNLTQPTTTANIAASALTVAGISATNKVYDGTTLAAIRTNDAVLVGVVGSDQVTLILTNAIGDFNTKTVGTNKTVTIVGLEIVGPDAGKYALTLPTTNADITSANLTISGPVADNKVYDRTTTATLDVSGAVLVGTASGDAVTIDAGSAVANFITATVGNGKPVTVTGLSLTGADAGNYTLTQPSATADITPAGLTITGISANDKFYDGGVSATFSGTSTLAGVFNGDTVTLGGAATAHFATATAANNKPVTVAGFTIGGADSTNYSLTQPTLSASIIPVTLSVTADNQTRVYGAANPALTATITGFVNGENQASALTGQPDVTTSATLSSGVGSYPINVAVGTLSAVNYSFAFIAGTLSITKATTTAGITSSINPALPSDNVTFTAVVTPVAPGTGTPAGTVQFKKNGSNLGGPVTLVSGQAALTMTGSDIGHGSLSITADYANSDGNFNTSVGTLSPNQVINTAPTIAVNPVTYERAPGITCRIRLSSLYTNANVTDPDGDSFQVTYVGTPVVSGATATVNSTFIFYTPAPENGSQSDSFTYTVSDSLGATVQGTININVTNAYSPVLQQIIPGDNGSMIIRFDGIPNYTYVLQQATSLAGAWTDIVTNTAGTNGLFQYIDLTPPQPQGYYRVRLP